MKIGQFFKKMVGGSMILATLAAPVFTSCYDDAPLWDKVEDLDSRLTALEAKLNTDLAALQTLLESQINALAGNVEDLTGNVEDLAGKVDALVTVKNCKEQADGSYVITLSDGTEFTVYPKYKENHTGLVTTTEIDGVLYWALIDSDGKAVVVTDADKNPIPVIDVVPQVKVDAETAMVSISFDGGKTWIEIGTDTPYIFADAEIVTTDYYTEEQEAENPEYCVEDPMYVVLTLADGNTITVTIDGAAAFVFGGHMGGLVSVQYISAGSTTNVGFMATNIQDWIKEVPAGWVVKEVGVENAAYGGASFQITAPTAEAIASGAAVAEGNIKVIAVAEGGSTVTASVKVTTKPYSKFEAGKGNVTVLMNKGLYGYLVGVSKVDEFNKNAIVEELTPVITEIVESPWGSYPGWDEWVAAENETTLDDNFFGYSIEDMPLADLNSIPEMTLGEKYVVWTVAIEYWEDEDYNYGYNVGQVDELTYSNTMVELETSKLAFNDIQINAEFKGIDAFYGQFAMQYSDDLNMEGIIAEFNSSLTSSWGAPEPIMVSDVATDGVYVGNPNDLVNGWQEIGPAEKYYLYLIPVEEGKTKYSMSDVYFYQWETPALTAGGSLAITAGEAVLEHKKITVPLTAEGAVYIYYTFVEPEMVSTIEDKAEYLLEKGYIAEGGEYDALKSGLNPSQTMTLIAMAVDKDGKYGEVYQKDYTTKAMTYAEAVVKAELQGTPAQTGKVKVSCEGAEVVKYYYWSGAADAYQWTNASYFGGSVETASAFIALTPNSYLLDKVAPADMPEDGIEIEGLTVGAPSLFVVSAELADGTFTKATVVEFTPSMDLGEFVYAKDENGADNAAWVAAKPTVTYETDLVGDFTTVTWTVELPEGFSGMTACMSEDNLVDYPSAKSKVQYILTDEYVGAETVVADESYVQPYASKGYKIYTVIWDADGNYYETYVEDLDITGGFGQ